MSDEAYLRLNSVSKAFGKTKVVDDVSFEVNRGEFVTLLGPSGCGKTTTLRMIAGLAVPTSGEILIKGERINDKPVHRRNIGMVFQHYALFPHMTVFENIAFGLRRRHVPNSEIQTRVKKTLELIQLEEMGRRLPRQLSGGQQQRVALGRALVIEPDVLLMDEPLSNLDFKLRGEMRSEIKSIQNAIGITSVYVTHDQTEALVMSDRVIVMNKGKVVQNDRPVEIYERPRSMFVAGFVGDANFFEGKVSGLDPIEGQISTKGGRRVFFAHHGETMQIGSQVTLCIRPERIRISREKTQEKNSYSLRIEQVAFMGSISRYFLKSEKDGPMVVDIPILTVGSQFKVGDIVFAEWAPEDTRMVVEDQR